MTDLVDAVGRLAMNKDSNGNENPIQEKSDKKRSRGRPKKEGGPTSGAERIAKLRTERKEAGLCPCCGQPVPAKPKNKSQQQTIKVKE